MLFLNHIPSVFNGIKAIEVGLGREYQTPRGGTRRESLQKITAPCECVVEYTVRGSGTFDIVCHPCKEHYADIDPHSANYFE